MIIQAPAGFGPFGGDVLVGNFGDGRILAYDPGTGAFQGALLDTVGSPIAIEGLWGLAFGRAASGAEVAQRLYFAAGIDGETHGLFGFIAEADSDSTAPPPPVATCDDNESKGPGFWRKVCGGPLPSGHDGDHPGNGHENGQGNKNGHDHDHGRGNSNGHGPFADVDPDSLDILFACIEVDGPPNAFGVDGCFTAGCDLMRKVGKRSELERAAQVLLLTRLNLCSGAVCDSFAITCVEAQNGVQVLTIGDVADSLDALLCEEDGDRDDIRHFVDVLRCVIEDDDDDDDEDDARDAVTQKIAVKTVGVNPARLSDGPVRFAVNATSPSMVQLRIYDARGRLVAEPMRMSMVVDDANVTWDGTDSQGQAVAPGVYFYRAVGGGESASGRLMIVR